MAALEEFVGESALIRTLKGHSLSIIARQASLRRLPPMLLLGETGVGKGLLARAMHRAGSRAAGPFVSINCAAIPETMIEAELFGFERGAFTDARQAKAGLFQTAHRGTLLLDEVGMLPPSAQAKLLTALDDKTVRRLGSTREEEIDVWIVAATNEDLHSAIRHRRFREDLYHRLSAIVLDVPPLRERGRDAQLLAERFLDSACEDYGLPRKVLSPEATAALLHHRWPGNVRELANLMERVAILNDDVVITPAALGLAHTADPPRAASTDAMAVAEPRSGSLRDSLDEFERSQLMAALEAERWNISRAAQRLGIARGTLRYRIDKARLHPPGARDRRRGPAGDRQAATRPPVTPPLAIQWERRPVTSVAFKITMEPDAARPSLIAQVFGDIRDRVTGFGGVVQDVGPMTMVAAFGLHPIEGASNRALLCALAVHKHVQRRGDEPTSLVAAAVHTAQCLISRTPEGVIVAHEDRAGVWSVLSMLIDGMPAGDIVVSAATVPSVERRFAFAPVPNVPGCEGARRLIGHEAADPVSAGRQVGRFVGRDTELLLLQAALAEAQAGQGRIVGIIGEAGVGKSRLLSEFRRRIPGQIVCHIEGRCLSHGATVPYGPVGELLRQLCHVEGGDDPAAVIDRVTNTLTSLDLPVETHRPHLLRVLGVAADAEAHEPSQVRTLDVLRRLCIAVSGKTPLVVVIEDLHWIDPPSEAFLSALIEDLPRARILLILTYRPGFKGSWTARAYASQISLPQLGRDLSREIVAPIVAGHGVPEPLIEVILSKAEGNPFFLEECAWAVRVREHSERSFALPATVEDVVLTRIDRLPAGDKELLQLGAVFGRTVPLAVLEVLWAEGSPALQARLRDLVTADLLHETWHEGQAAYAFKHAVTHEVTYRSLLPDRRRDLHRRILDQAERLEVGPAHERIERLAHHAVQAEAWEQAARYLQQAGTRAFGHSDYPLARSRFEEALDALSRVPDSPAKIERGIDIRLALRFALSPLGRFDDILRALGEAEALASSLGDEKRAAMIACSLTNYYQVTGRLEQALECGQRALAVGARLFDATIEITAGSYVSLIHQTMGDHRPAIAVGRVTLARLAGADPADLFGMPLLPGVYVRHSLSRALAEMGDFTEAAAASDEAIGIARSARHAYSIAFSLVGLAFVRLRQDRGEDARALLEESMGMSARWDSPTMSSLVGGFFGMALAATRRTEDARRVLDDARQQARLAGLASATLPQGIILMAVAQTSLVAGEPDAAVTACQHAIDVFRPMRARGYHAWSAYLLGSAHLQRREVDAARACLVESAEVAATLNMRPLAARCHRALARVYADRGESEAAREAQATSDRLFAALGTMVAPDVAFVL